MRRCSATPPQRPITANRKQTWKPSPRSPYHPEFGDDCLEAARFVLDGKHPALGRARPAQAADRGSLGRGALGLDDRPPPARRQGVGVVSISEAADVEADYKTNPELVKLRWGREPSAAELATASPITYARKDGPPVLCTHAYFDAVVPFSSSAGFVEKARDKGERVEFHSYDRAHDGHCIWIPGSAPHRLHPDIKDAVKVFVSSLWP